MYKRGRSTLAIHIDSHTLCCYWNGFREVLEIATAEMFAFTIWSLLWNRNLKWSRFLPFKLFFFKNKTKTLLVLVVPSSAWLEISDPNSAALPEQSQKHLSVHFVLLIHRVIILWVSFKYTIYLITQISEKKIMIIIYKCISDRMGTIKNNCVTNNCSLTFKS